MKTIKISDSLYINANNMLNMKIEHYNKELGYGRCTIEYVLTVNFPEGRTYYAKRSESKEEVIEALKKLNDFLILENDNCTLDCTTL